MAKVGIILGSKSDFEVAVATTRTLREFKIDFDLIISSAHRTPERTVTWVKNAEKNDIKVIIAIAGAAAHLAGVVASKTILPVIAVPVASTALCGIDALLSSVQMPSGIPVATMAIGIAGAKNAAILACQILALYDDLPKQQLIDFKNKMIRKIENDNEEIQDQLKS